MPAEYRRRVEHLAHVVGLDGELFKPLRSYSGGMKRKLEIIRSLMHRPGILFLDEPTSGLDPVSRNALWRYLRDVRNEDGTTVFLTTHYLEEAEEADRVCVVDHGRIAMIGSPDHMKRELLERSIVLDAVDRDGLLAELHALGLEPGDRPDRPRPRGLRRRHGAGPHQPDPDAVERPAGPRTEPRRGVRRARRELEGGGMSTNVVVAPRRWRPRGGIRSGTMREANATFAIAWREILSAIRNPVSIVVTIIIPVIFMGILGGSISQNLGTGLQYAYLPFMLIGMIANTLYQGTITGVTNLVEERENDFTAELFVAPVSRYTVLMGKMLGAASPR